MRAVKVLPRFSGAKRTKVYYHVILAEKGHGKKKRTDADRQPKSIVVTLWKNIDRRKSNYSSLPLRL